MKKKVLSLVLSASMVSSMLPAMAYAADGTTTFPDMPNDWSTTALQSAIDNGLLNGIDGKIAASENLTRAQMAAIVTRAFGTNGNADISGFGDVNSGDWFYNAMAAAVNMGAFQGDGTGLNPNANITRQEAFTVLARLFTLSGADQSVLNSFSDAGQVADWAKDSMASMVQAGYVSGDRNMLKPTSSITRAEFAQVMYNLLSDYMVAGEDGTNVQGNAILNQTGTLSNVTVSGDLIVGDGAGEGDVTLNNVTVSGRLLVRGGGVNTVTLEGNTTVGGQIVVNKPTGDVRVHNSTSNEFDAAVISDGATLTGEFDVMEVTASGTTTVTGATVNTVNVSAAASLSVTGESKVDTVNLDAASSKLNVNGNSTVTTVNVPESASNASIDVANGSTVTNVNTAANGVSIDGEGKVSNVKVEGNNTSVDTVGTKVTVASGVTGTTSNGKDIAAGTTVTTTANGTTGGGSTGGGSTGGDDDVAIPSVPSISADHASTSVFPTGVESTANGLSQDKNAEIESGVTKELSQDDVAAMGAGGQYVNYITVPKSIVEKFTKITYKTNDGEELTWEATSENFENKECAGWATADGENWYFKFGTTFAEKYNGFYQMKGNGTFNTSIKFYDGDTVVATLDYTVDLSKVTIEQPADIAGFVSSTHAFPADLSSTAEGLSRDENAELDPATKTLSQNKVASMGEGGQYVNYITVDKVVGTDFDTVMLQTNNGTVSEWKIDTVGDTDKGWYVSENEKTYFKFGTQFAEMTSTGWAMKNNGTFTTTVTLKKEGNIVGSHTYTVDLSNVTITPAVVETWDVEHTTYDWASMEITSGGGENQLAQDASAELDPDTKALTQEQVSSMAAKAGGGQYVNYFKINGDNTNFKLYDTIIYQTNDGEALTWNIKDDNDKNGWYTSTEDYSAFKFGTAFATKGEDGVWTKKADTFVTTVTFVQNNVVVGQYTTPELFADLEIVSPTQDVTTVEDLKNALKTDGVSTVNITSNMAIPTGQDPLEIPEGKIVNVQEGVTLTIGTESEAATFAEGDTLTVNGTLNVAGTVKVLADAKVTIAESGAVQVAEGATLTNNGTVTVAENATLTDNGTVTVAENATLTNNGTVTVAEGATLTNNGTVTVAEGATLTNNGTLTNNSTMTVADTAKVEGSDNVEGTEAGDLNTMNLLKTALAYDYSKSESGKSYEYHTDAVISVTEDGVVVSYAGKAEDFLKAQELDEDDAPTNATADLARFLGALYRVDSGTSVTSLKYGEDTYTWNGESTRKGSNWEKNGDTLVSALVQQISSDMGINGLIEPETDAQSSFEITIGEVVVTFNITVAADTGAGA